MAAFRELPHSGRFHMSRLPDLSFEEAIDRSNDPLTQHHEQRGFPIRAMITGRVNIGRFHQSSQLEVLINLTHTFTFM